VLALVENTLRGLHQRAARHRGMRLLAEALDQLHAEAPLEFADLQADRGLRQVETARRGGEIAELDDLEQGSQLVEVEAAHAKLALSKSLQLKICLIGEAVASSGWGRGENQMRQISIATAAVSIVIAALFGPTAMIAKVPQKAEAAVAPVPIDIAQITRDAKNLPAEQYDAH
jgi:hypothetical protein